MCLLILCHIYYFNVLTIMSMDSGTNVWLQELHLFFNILKSDMLYYVARFP